jgi:hypothetical protein
MVIRTLLFLAFALLVGFRLIGYGGVARSIVDSTVGEDRWMVEEHQQLKF